MRVVQVICKVLAFVLVMLLVALPEVQAIFFGYAAAVIWCTLPIVYGVTAPDWRKSRMGNALMLLLGSTAGLFVLLLTGRIFGDYAIKEYVHGGVYALVLYAGVHLALLFVQLRIEVERRIREGK